MERVWSAPGAERQRGQGAAEARLEHSGSAARAQRQRGRGAAEARSEHAQNASGYRFGSLMPR